MGLKIAQKKDGRYYRDINHMSKMQSPNILVLIWDACRYDAAQRHAPTLQSLAEDNIWFENAIAPAPWTLPSHVSMFTGKYPREHRIFRPGQSSASYPLVEELGEDYTTYGISGNPFFSHQTGAHRAFDEFYYTTPTIFTDGLNATELYEIFGETGSVGGETNSRTVLTLLKKVKEHSRSLKSLANALSVITLPFARQNRLLNRIPHSRFNELDTFSYSPERNTKHIERIVRSEAESDGAFFIFANYMDTHRPYVPPPEYQHRHIGRELSYRELNRIDKTVSDTWTHLERLKRGEVTENEIDLLEKLYAGTVNSVDDQLKQIIEIVDEFGERENTFILVTSDHGEALGSENEMGQRRVGHQMTISDDVLRVPLVIAHPEIDSTKIESYWSLKNIYHIIKNIPNNQCQEWINDYSSTANPTFSEYPPKYAKEAYELHPEIPDSLIRSEVSESTEIVYYDNWKVVMNSDQKVWTAKDGRECNPNQVPSELLDTCNEKLHNLLGEDGTRITESGKDQLKDLGYL